MNANKEINRAVGWSIALSVLMIVAGVLAIIVPPASGIALTILVGWLLVFCGGTHLAYAWQTRHNGGLWWGILLGVIYIVAGGYMLLHPMAGLASLTLMLAAYEVCRRLKADEHCSRVPIIFISASGETDKKVKGFDAGGVD